jgi:hypothetical protein
MTTKEFLKLFRKTISPSRWAVVNGSSIRHRTTGHCPLSWMAHFVDKNITACEVVASRRLLKLNPRVAMYIVDAADDTGRNTPTRKALLAAIAR